MGLDPSPKKQQMPAVTDNGVVASKGVKDNDEDMNAFDEAENDCNMIFEPEGTGDGV
jgi:hypothetical protein